MRALALNLLIKIYNNNNMYDTLYLSHYVYSLNPHHFSLRLQSQYHIFFIISCIICFHFLAKHRANRQLSSYISIILWQQKMIKNMFLRIRIILRICIRKKILMYIHTQCYNANKFHMTQQNNKSGQKSIQYSAMLSRNIMKLMRR
jgi:hypothetical protein